MPTVVDHLVSMQKEINSLKSRLGTRISDRPDGSVEARLHDLNTTVGIQFDGKIVRSLAGRVRKLEEGAGATPCDHDAESVQYRLKRLASTVGDADDAWSLVGRIKKLEKQVGYGSVESQIDDWWLRKITTWLGVTLFVVGTW